MIGFIKYFHLSSCSLEILFSIINTLGFKHIKIAYSINSGMNFALWAFNIFDCARNNTLHVSSGSQGNNEEIAEKKAD